MPQILCIQAPWISSAQRSVKIYAPARKAMQLWQTKLRPRIGDWVRERNRGRIKERQKLHDWSTKNTCSGCGPLPQDERLAEIIAVATQSKMTPMMPEAFIPEASFALESQVLLGLFG